MNYFNHGYVKLPLKKNCAVLPCNHWNEANLRDLIDATGLVILLKIVFISSFFGPCNLEIWWMTPKNNRAPVLPYNKHCTSFQSHRWIQTGFQSGNAQFMSKWVIFLSCVTWKIDEWPWKSIGHIFYNMSSFVHHFKANSEFKLELQSGNDQFGSKSVFFGRVTSKFDGWPWKTIGYLLLTTSSFVHHFKLELQSGNAHFQQKLTNFCPVWTWNLMDYLEKP